MREGKERESWDRTAFSTHAFVSTQSTKKLKYHEFHKYGQEINPDRLTRKNMHRLKGMFTKKTLVKVQPNEATIHDSKEDKEGLVEPEVRE